MANSSRLTRQAGCRRWFERSPVRAVHLSATGSPVQQPVLIGGRSEHADLNLGDLSVGRGAHGVNEIEGRIARGTI